MSFQYLAGGSVHKKISLGGFSRARMISNASIGQFGFQGTSVSRMTASAWCCVNELYCFHRTQNPGKLFLRNCRILQQLWCANLERASSTVGPVCRGHLRQQLPDFYLSSRFRFSFLWSFIFHFTRKRHFTPHIIRRFIYANMQGIIGVLSSTNPC